jgi:hypothetical protein
MKSMVYDFDNSKIYRSYHIVLQVLRHAFVR